MYWLRRMLLWLPGRRRARARELEEELQSNLALAMEEAGSEREARRDFGSLTRAREEVRSVWFPGWDALAQDLRYAARTLRKTPVFSIVAVLSLAFGTGAATALFSLVDTVVLKPLSYRDPGRLLVLREVVVPLAHIYPSLPVNFQHYRLWSEQTRAFDGLAAIIASSGTLYSGAEPETVGMTAVTANCFDVLGVAPQRGRTFRAGEDQPKKNTVAVITDGLWRRRFGASEDTLGRTIRLADTQYTVVGILAPSFHFPKRAEFGPLTGLSENTEIFVPIQQARMGWGGDYDYIVVGRLRHGISTMQGIAELNLFENRIVAEHKLSPGLHVQARPLQEMMSSPVRTSLAVLLSAVLVLVLIVCVNLANLLVARGSARAREYAMRVALGASQGRLLFSALVETMLLAGVGGLLGLLVAKTALGLFVRTASVSLPRLDEVRLDSRITLFAFGLTLFCGLLFGLLPALRYLRVDPQPVLRGESQNASAGRQGLRLREWLVGGEVALSTLLLVLAGLLVSSLWQVLRVDRGFTDGAALDVSVRIPARYQQAKDRVAFFELALEHLRQLPGVREVAVANRVPLTGESNVNHAEPADGDAGPVDARNKELIMVNLRFVSQDYFMALGIPVMQGRAIEAGDRDRNVAVISGRLAARLWPGRNPLGRSMSTSAFGVPRVEIVGVVGDVHSTQLDNDPTLMVYVPYWKQAWQASDLVVRSTADPRSLPEQVRRVIREIDPTIPAPKMRTMDEIVAESVAQRRFQMKVTGGFAISALLLAALGIYGVVAYGVALRRREIGIRMALGARTGEVRRLVVGQGLLPVAIGLACGIGAALAAGGVVRSLLFGVSPADAPTLAAVAGSLALVATLACLLPAYSASRIEPSRVLRDE
jgi:putative ABC transport system permease protein